MVERCYSCRRSANDIISSIFPSSPTLTSSSSFPPLYTHPHNSKCLHALLFPFKKTHHTLFYCTYQSNLLYILTTYSSHCVQGFFFALHSKISFVSPHLQIICSTTHKILGKHSHDFLVFRSHTPQTDSYTRWPESNNNQDTSKRNMYFKTTYMNYRNIKFHVLIFWQKCS